MPERKLQKECIKNIGLTAFINQSKIYYRANKKVNINEKLSFLCLIKNGSDTAESVKGEHNMKLKFVKEISDLKLARASNRNLRLSFKPTNNLNNKGLRMGSKNTFVSEFMIISFSHATKVIGGY